MYGYIYKTTNLINNKKYIGQHKAKNFDTKYKGSGILLQEAIRKYGWDSFSCELIEECFSEDELNLREVYWISYYDANNSDEFYNIAAGGLGHTCDPWNKGKHQPPSGDSKKGLEIGWHLPASNKLKKKLSEYRKSVVVSDSTRKKLSDAQRGKRTVNDGFKNIIVDVEDLDYYLSIGYIRGRVKNN